MQFSQLSRLYLDVQSLYLKQRSIQTAEESFHVLNKTLGRISITKLTDTHLSRFIKVRKEKVKDTTINRELRYLKVALRFALERGYIEALPFRIRMLKTPRKRILRVLTREQIRSLLDCADDPIIHGILLVSANTGLRLSEITHLTWEDIFWDEGKIAVSSKDDWSPKNHQERSIYIPDSLMGYFQDRWNSTGTPQDEDWIFPSKTGGALNTHTLGGRIRTVFKKAGLYQKGCPTTHWLRSTYASTLLQNGIPIHAVKEILGHCSVTVTELYLNTSDDQMRKASAVMGI